MRYREREIQWYLAAELRDRIRVTGVRINIVDKMAHKQYAVEPRQYEGRLLHQLPLLRTPLGDIYVELFLNEPSVPPPPAVAPVMRKPEFATLAFTMLTALLGLVMAIAVRAMVGA